MESLQRELVNAVKAREDFETKVQIRAALSGLLLECVVQGIIEKNFFLSVLADAVRQGIELPEDAAFVDASIREDAKRIFAAMTDPLAEPITDDPEKNLQFQKDHPASLDGGTF